MNSLGWRDDLNALVTVNVQKRKLCTIKPGSSDSAGFIFQAAFRER
jgi:hypothetical protein